MHLSLAGMMLTAGEFLQLPFAGILLTEQYALDKMETGTKKTSRNTANTGFLAQSYWETQR